MRLRRSNTLMLAVGAVVASGCGRSAALRTTAPVTTSAESASASSATIAPTPGHVRVTSPSLDLVAEGLTNSPPKDARFADYVRTALYVVRSSPAKRVSISVDFSPAFGTDSESPPMPDLDIKVRVRSRNGLAKVFKDEGSIVGWIE
jgi:hypothetical protein